MADTDTAFTGSIPEIYDGRLVPLIFEPYAADLARRIAALQPARVLETAAGSGVVARALAPLLGAGARYVVTDLNQPMLDRAIARQPADARIEWRQADALALPYPDASFDVVCCQFGAMFFPDRVAGYREALRVLAPGGTFLLSVWDRVEANDFARIVTEAAAALFPDDPPRFLARLPHGYHDVAAIEADLRAAGFGTVAIETVAARSEAAEAEAAASALCRGTPLRPEIEARGPGAIERVIERAAAAIAAAHGEGPVSGGMRAHVATAQV